MIINNQYKVGRKLGAGNFGEIRLGKDENSGRLVAIKIEIHRHDKPQLASEYRHYMLIHKGGRQVGVPEAYYYGSINKANVMVIELLGSSLEDLFDMCNRKFSVLTVIEIARQTIRRLQTIHAKNILHRDIKPENFLIGSKKSMADTIYIVDFGLSKEYVDPQTNQHIPYRENKNLTGTARYMSINTHLGKEQSRRDDLEALCHMLFYFLRGSLPWQGLKAENLRDRYNKICEVKRTTTIDDLCEGFPEEFATFLRYSRHLEFNEVPNYDYLVSLFDSYLTRTKNVDHRPLFDWKPLIEAKSHDPDRASRMVESLIGEKQKPILEKNDKAPAQDSTPTREANNASKDKKKNLTSAAALRSVVVESTLTEDILKKPSIHTEKLNSNRMSTARIEEPAKPSSTFTQDTVKQTSPVHKKKKSIFYCCWHK